MSTKIYGGHLLAEGLDVFDAPAAIRAVCDSIRDRRDAKLLVGMAVSAGDHRALGSRETAPQGALGSALAGDSLLTGALLRYMDEQHRADPALRWHDPHRLEVSFGRDPLTGRIAVHVYEEGGQYATALREAGVLIEYAYWNNTDRPDEVSEVEWAERRDLWDRILPRFDPPAVRMLSWALRTSPIDPGTWDVIRTERDQLLTDVMPERAARVHARAVSTVLHCARATVDVHRCSAHIRVHAL